MGNLDELTLKSYPIQVDLSVRILADPDISPEEFATNVKNHVEGELSELPCEVDMEISEREDDASTFSHDEPCDWSRGERPRCNQMPTAHVGDIYYACEDHYDEFAEWVDAGGSDIDG